MTEVKPVTAEQPAPEKKEEPVSAPKAEEKAVKSEAKAESVQNKKQEEPAANETKTEKASDEKLDLNKPYEEMSVAELQACILAKMAKNGPVTDRMRKDVEENVYPNSLLNWVRSFR